MLCKREKIVLPIFLIAPVSAFLIANQALPVKFSWALLAYLVGTILFYPRKNHNK